MVLHFATPGQASMKLCILRTLHSFSQQSSPAVDLETRKSWKYEKGGDTMETLGFLQSCSSVCFELLLCSLAHGKRLKDVELLKNLREDGVQPYTLQSLGRL